MPQREKRIYSGSYLEVEIYQIDKKTAKQSRAQKLKESLPKQKSLNLKNSKKHLTRLINANFTENDLHLTLTYKKDELPETDEQSEKDMRNFIRRLRNWRRRIGMPELKYIAVIERKGKDGRSARVDHHIILSGDMDREQVEAMWKKGRCNSMRLQPDECGLSDLSQYISKNIASGKKWSQSKNLRQPTVAVNDHKYSRSRLIALVESPAPRELEKLYPGYAVSRVETGFNEVTESPFINIFFRQIEVQK